MPELPVIQSAEHLSCTAALSESDSLYNFYEILDKFNLSLPPMSVNTLQVNITRLCNQACHHCHVDASPIRTEQMDRPTLERCLEILAEHKGIEVLDITGGAPELNPHFDDLVIEARKLGKHVIVRHNLTVTFDGNPQTGESKTYLPEFFAGHHVEVVSSLPYYQEYFTDKQRGKGVFGKSVEAIRLLNQQGYGSTETGLELNLVYNPVGAFLPAPESELEPQYRKELREKYDVAFNNLFAITNMPIHRFKNQLKRMGAYEEYMDRLIEAFNPIAAANVMCRTMISVGYDGRLYDCDFNQMLDMEVDPQAPKTIFDFNLQRLLDREIQFGAHCLGCTAGAGSSCGGETT